MLFLDLACQRAGQGFLVLGSLWCPASFHAANTTDSTWPKFRATSWHEVQQRWLDHFMVRAQGSKWKGIKLASNNSGQNLVCVPAALWPLGVLVQSHLAPLRNQGRGGWSETKGPSLTAALRLYIWLYWLYMYTFAAGLRWLAISCHWNCSVYVLPGVREWLISGHVATQWAKLRGQGFRRQWFLLRQAANGQGHICLKSPKWMVQWLDWFKGKS